MGALKEKTVILVTHQVEFLHAVDLILVCCELFIIAKSKKIPLKSALF
jgi:ABC-type transport system involved in cytochrome bd biosynthesis fused ATPase/permease subunit